jgi:hypothetical protein
MGVYSKFMAPLSHGAGSKRKNLAVFQAIDRFSGWVPPTAAVRNE